MGSGVDLGPDFGTMSNVQETEPCNCAECEAYRTLNGMPTLNKKPSAFEIGLQEFNDTIRQCKR